MPRVPLVEPVPSDAPVPRKEGREKVTALRQYVDDLRMAAMIHGGTIRSPSARGKLLEIELGGDLPWDEFTVRTGRRHHS